MKIKYLEERARMGGSVFVVNPPQKLRDAIGAEYRHFGQDRAAAIAYAMQVSDAYTDTKAGRQAVALARRHSVQGAFDAYLASAAFARLKPSSQAIYRYSIHYVGQMMVGPVSLADMPVHLVTPATTDALVQEIQSLHGLSRCHEAVKVMRIVWYYAERRSMIVGNPWSRIGLAKAPSRSKQWTTDQIDLFVYTADAMGLPQIGTHVLLCYELCQRPGDVRQIKWSDLHDGVFSIRQEKTGIEVHPPASPRLLARLSMHRHNHPTVICDADGAPYNRYIHKLVAKVRDAAGLPADVWASDLRRTGATELGEAGVTEDELRAITGHASRSVLNIYVKPTRKLASNGAAKRFMARK